MFIFGKAILIVQNSRFKNATNLRLLSRSLGDCNDHPSFLGQRTACIETEHYDDVPWVALNLVEKQPRKFFDDDFR